MVNKKPVKVNVQKGPNGKKFIKDPQGNPMFVQKDAFGNEYIVDKTGTKKYIGEDGVINDEPLIVFF